MKTKFNNFIKLYESPDSVYYKLLREVGVDGNNLSWSDDDAISFGYYDNYSDIENILVSDWGQTHEEAIENYTGEWEQGRADMELPGRMWTESKIISFWEYPDNYKELKTVLFDIEREMLEKHDVNLRIDDDWWIEVIFNGDEQVINKYKFWGDSEMGGDQRYIDDTKLIRVGDYKGSAKRSAAQLAMKHLEVGKGGADVPQGFGSKNKKKPIEFRNALGKFRGESVQFTYNKELSPKFWNDNLFDERIREKLITIANDFYNELGYDAPIDDIILVGSLCNFNYNKYSDLDIHIVVDFSKIDKNVELVTKAVDSERFMWNLRHNIRIKGHDVELYIQDINSENISGGIFSLQDSKWINVPVYNQPQIEEDLINFKFLTYQSGIQKLEEISQRVMSPEVAMKNHLYVSEYKKKIKNERQNDLADGGEFSVGNLVFKKLRNSGDYGKLIDIKTLLYDKIYSQTQ